MLLLVLWGFKNLTLELCGHILIPKFAGWSNSWKGRGGKKMRHGEQKAEEQRQGEKVDVKERIDDMLEAVPQAEQSGP